MHQDFDGLRRVPPAEEARADAFQVQPGLEDLDASAARPLPDEVGSLTDWSVGGDQAGGLYLAAESPQPSIRSWDCKLGSTVPLGFAGSFKAKRIPSIMPSCIGLM